MPYCIIGPNVTIGAGSKLHSHVVVGGYTRIGEYNEILPVRQCRRGVVGS